MNNLRVILGEQVWELGYLYAVCICRASVVAQW